MWCIEIFVSVLDVLHRKMHVLHKSAVVAVHARVVRLSHQRSVLHVLSATIGQTQSTDFRSRPTDEADSGLADLKYHNYIISVKVNLSKLKCEDVRRRARVHTYTRKHIYAREKVHMHSTSRKIRRWPRSSFFEKQEQMLK